MGGWLGGLSVVPDVMCRMVGAVAAADRTLQLQLQLTGRCVVGLLSCLPWSVDCYKCLVVRFGWLMWRC